MKPLEELLQGLSSEQLQEFADAVLYLTEKAGGDGSMPEQGGVGGLLNSLSPAVRERFALLSNVLETPRVAPFAPKLSERDHARSFGFDPDTTELLKAALDGQEVAGRVQSRMGTDADRPPEPLTRRDQIAAAFDAVQP